MQKSEAIPQEWKVLRAGKKNYLSWSPPPDDGDPCAPVLCVFGTNLEQSPINPWAFNSNNRENNYECRARESRALERFLGGQQLPEWSRWSGCEYGARISREKITPPEEGTESLTDGLARPTDCQPEAATKSARSAGGCASGFTCQAVNLTHQEPSSHPASYPDIPVSGWRRTPGAIKNFARKPSQVNMLGGEVWRRGFLLGFRTLGKKFKRMWLEMVSRCICKLFLNFLLHQLVRSFQNGLTKWIFCLRKVSVSCMMFLSIKCLNIWRTIF